MGDGIVIEAMGTLKGVTTTKVSAGKWTHWGELAGIDYVNAGQNGQLTINNEQLKELNGHKTILKGSKGSVVKECQTRLVELGYDVGSCGIDGIFGKETLAAVKAFQQDHRLKVDGIVGPQTWKALTNQNYEL